jgi:hypothetical protein
MHQMIQIIPQLDYGLEKIMFVANCAQTGRAQEEISASLSSSSNHRAASRKKCPLGKT